MLQLFTLLYADDTIILSNTEKDLQYSLQIYAEYCQKWKLIVNIDKSKILVFGKDTKRINFTLNGVELERVKTFKYLGLMFSKNGKYVNAVKHNIDKARKASFAIAKRARQLNLSVSCHIHIINTVVKSILLYGCEVFCFEKLDIIDSFYVQTLKRILHVRKSTPDYMVYGETGCNPPSVDIKQRAMTFWHKTHNSSQKSLPKICQNVLVDCNEGDEYSSQYIKYIKKSFNDSGLTHLYGTYRDDIQTQNLNQNINTIKRRTKDQYIQKWHEDKNTSPKALFYNIIKHDFGFEEYLDILCFKKRITLTRLRTSNHSLPIEVGRWDGTPRELRTCPICPGNVLGDEFHFLLQCNLFEDVRKMFLKKHTIKNPNVYKTYILFNSKNKKTLNSLSNFIQLINNVME